MDDLAFRPAVELAAMVARGDLSSRELVELHLERIERLDPDLHAVVTLDAEGARRTADELDAAPAPVGPLHGVPMTIKDAFATAGIRTTSGMVERADHVPVRDADLVARLRAAGVVILGKTAVPREITGQETGSALFGRTRNPWDRARSPGGSSGGAAAALAAGLTPLELGSDSGGSIRQPAHCCGVYGHVATAELLPLRGHQPTIDADEEERHVDLTSVGPMARSARDLDVALEVLAGRPLPPPTVRSLDGACIGLLLDQDVLPVEAAVAERIEAAADAAAAAGADVRRIDFPVGVALRQAFALWLASPTERTELAHRERAALDAEWAALFDVLDVVLCPISPVTAPPHDPDPALVDDLDRRLARTIDVDERTRPYLDQMGWNIVVGAAGLPATAAPVGQTAAGLPVGLQVVGPRGHDRTCIAVADLLAGVVGGFEQPPGC